jgi:hypothetical protein
METAKVLKHLDPGLQEQVVSVREQNLRATGFETFPRLVADSSKGCDRHEERGRDGIV